MLNANIKFKPYKFYSQKAVLFKNPAIQVFILLKVYQSNKSVVRVNKFNFEFRI